MVKAMLDESVSDGFRRRSQGFAAVVSAVPGDRWDASTPCQQWNARQLVGHVVDTQYMFAGFIGLEPERRAPVDDDPDAAWDVARSVTQSALDDPDLANQEFDGFFGRSTFASAVDRFLTLDLVIHRWDLATAAGLDATLPKRDVVHLEASARELAGVVGDAMRTGGAFGPALDAPRDADAQTRLLAFVGRRAW